jgi:hypothetical protein
MSRLFPWVKEVRVCILCLALLSLGSRCAFAAQNSSQRAVKTAESATESVPNLPEQRSFWNLLIASAAIPTNVAAFVPDQSPTSVGSSSLPSPNTFLVASSVLLSGSPTAVSVGDLDNDGKLDLVVANSDAGTVDVLLGKGDGSFRPAVHYTACKTPAFVVLGDFDGDGNLDVAVADQADNTISVLLGRGDGTLQRAVTYKGVAGPAYVVVGDFNSDGHPDLAVAAALGKSVAVLLNKGDGTFDEAVSYAVGIGPRSLTLADFNGDGRLDLASANSDGTVSIMLGKGNGRFQSAVTFDAGSGSLSALAAGDFNADGKPDLAIADSSASNVSVLLGNGDGTFQAGVNYSVGNSPTSLALADVNGDSVPDLVSANKSGNTFSILLGNGNGTFKTRLDFSVGNSPVAVAVGDFNGDGHLDLVTANFADHTVSVPLGNGDGTFQAARDYSTDLARKSVAVGDLNGDGNPDLVVTNFCGADSSCSGNGTANVLLGKGDGTYEAQITYPLGKGPISGLLADINGDKTLDLIVANQGDNTVQVLLGNGDGTFQSAVPYAVGNVPVSLTVGDFNNDGKMDLAVANQCGSGGCTEAGDVTVLLGNGDGSFQPAGSYPVGFSPSSVAIGDLNGDKNLDLVVANACGKDNSCRNNGTASVLIGNGKGAFTPQAEVNVGNHPSSVALGDLDGDGKLDLLVANTADNKLCVLVGNGDGTFKDPVAYKVGASPSSVVIADFDGDGRNDVAVANTQDSTVSLLFGHGDGGLKAAVNYSVGAGPVALVALPNRNRTADLVSANGTAGGTPAGNTITVLKNVSGALPPATTVTVTPNPAKVEVKNNQDFTATVKPSQAVTWSLDLNGKNCPKVCGTLTNVKADSVTYTAPATIPTGTVTIVATATDGSGAFGTATINITDFTLSLNPSSDTVIQGNSTPTITVTANPLQGYAGIITLSCVSPPPGITCSAFTPNPITVPKTPSATFTIKTVGNVVPKKYTVTVQGVDQAGAPQTRTTAFALTVQALTITPPTATVEVKNEHLFTANESVTWSLSGAHCSGATCGSVNPVTGASTTYTAPGTAPLGTVTLTATGAGGATTSATITVTDFKLGLNPGSDTVIQGNSTPTITVTASPFNSNGYTGTITLSCVSPPSGITCSAFTPNPITVPKTPSATFTIKTVGNLKSGVYPITVEGIDKAGVPQTRTTAFTLTVGALQITPPTATVEVNNTQLFTANESVTWSLSGAHCSGATCGSVNPVSGKSTTYTAPGTAPAGTVIVTATGAGSASATATITVTDFKLALSSSSVSAIQGSKSTTTTLTASAINGYAGTITPKCSGLPAGASCSFTPPTLVLPGAPPSTLEISTSGSTPVGSSAIAVTGTDGALIPVSHSDPLTLSVNCTFALENPLLISAGSPPAYSFSVVETAGGSNCPWTAATATSGITLTTDSGTNTAVNSAKPVNYQVAATANAGSIKVSYFGGSSTFAVTPQSPQLLQSVVEGQTVNAVLMPSGFGSGTLVRFPLLAGQNSVCSVANGPVTSPNNFGITCSAPTTPLPGTVPLTINVSSTTLSSLRRDHSPSRWAAMYALALGIPGIVFLGAGSSGFGKKRAKRRHRRLASRLGLGLIVLFVILLPACGGGFKANLTVPGASNTFTLTVMGTVTGPGNQVLGTQVFTLSIPVLPPS